MGLYPEEQISAHICNFLPKRNGFFRMSEGSSDTKEGLKFFKGLFWWWAVLHGTNV